MTDTTEELRPIIIRKKVIKVTAGHHGGAWKVAYADFVTAMMAFFLMMWLLGSTTEDQRKGISEYFNPNIPLAATSGGGSDILGGSSIFTENSKAQNGTGASSTKTYAEEVIKAQGAAQAQLEAKATAEAAMLETAEAFNDALKEAGDEISDHMQMKVTVEGLVIELIDSDTDPLFNIGDARPSPLLKKLITIVANSFQGVDNNIKVVGHTDSRAYIGTDYSNWELSTDRANMARRLLITNNFPHRQIVEVSGKADTDNVTEDGLAAQNRRISITILN
ncbi:MAG: chemotaxis protein MotB [Robiginitomaculum sp.]|nr:MAG: chemotaxis protein MotB [Robiginitomaculum sp.]